MTFPLPGEPVRGSKTGKPIMALLDLLGRTWSLGIIWNLHKSPCTFRQLQHECENISPTLLNKRIRELRATAIVEKTSKGYSLTHLGKELFQLIQPLGDWSISWNKSIKGFTYE